MSFLVYVILFFFGIALGSFLNVVSMRYNPELGVFEKRHIGGRSRCPYCRFQLKWYNLIPLISFIFQKGKCTNCRHKLSWQYPIVEFLSGAIFVLLAWFLNPDSQYGANFAGFKILGASSILNTNYLIAFQLVWIFVFLTFLLLSLIDLKHYIIPDSLNLILIVLGISNIWLMGKLQIFTNFSGSFLGTYGLILGLRQSIWINHLAAALGAFSFFLLIVILTRGRGMGWGDVKLAFALGLLFGWPDILAALFFAFVFGSIIGIYLMVVDKKKAKDMIPFGPFLVFGGVVTFFFGFYLARFYFDLFKIM